MNLADLRARVRMLAGAELEGLRENSEIDEVIRESYRNIAKLENWKWREDVKEFSTVNGTLVYDLPSGIEEIRGIQIIDAPGQTLPVKLREVSLRDLLNRVDRDDEDTPQFYARYQSNKIRVSPTPDDDYTVEVYGLAPLAGLEQDSDEPEWDSAYHAVIAYHAAYVILQEEGQEELSLTRRLRADELLAEMVEFYQITKDDQPIIVGGGQQDRPRVRALGRLYSWR